jgi:hypothetical protein
MTNFVIQQLIIGKPAILTDPFILGIRVHFLYFI